VTDGIRTRKRRFQPVAVPNVNVVDFDVADRVDLPAVLVVDSNQLPLRVGLLHLDDNTTPGSRPRR